MGKLITYLSILIFIDILFIATGQICSGGVCTISSIIFNAILNLSELDASLFFTELIGNFFDLFNSLTGLAALVTTGGVLIGTFIASKEIKILFIPIAFTFALIAGDFVIISSYLISLNFLLGTIFMAAITLIYIVVVVEWLRGKD